MSFDYGLDWILIRITDCEIDFQLSQLSKEAEHHNCRNRPFPGTVALMGAIRNKTDELDGDSRVMVFFHRNLKPASANESLFVHGAFMDLSFKLTSISRWQLNKAIRRSGFLGQAGWKK